MKSFIETMKLCNQEEEERPREMRCGCFPVRSDGLLLVSEVELVRLARTWEREQKLRINVVEQRVVTEEAS